MVDYVLLFSVAVIAAAVIILGFFLSRYRKLVNEANQSTRLAKDVWDSMNSRFTVVDTRIIDLMARTEVLSAKSIGGQTQSFRVTTPNPVGVPREMAKQVEISTITPKEEISRPLPATIHGAVGEGTETEARVLQLLLDGPKTSAQIKESVGRSREHTARLMKFLFDRGLVVRNSRNKPYVYELTESGKTYLGSWSVGK